LGTFRHKESRVMDRFVSLLAYLWAPLARSRADFLEWAAGLGARSHLGKRTQLWDGDEEVDLIGVAKVVFVPQAT
jgi:hypothetical protein